ncbi:MAG: GTPase Era, partial [Gammaproteobacteria bacterium]|nr:GTPase Era [Gammaproteobacteria bacterium]
VGKSTLLNGLLEQKISITSRRAQTTRHRVLGIKTSAQGQLILVDTPGIHAAQGRALNRYMNRAAAGALENVDVVAVLFEATRFTEADEFVLSRLTNVSVPVVAIVNKVDLVKDKAALLPFLQRLNEQREFHAVLPVSARRRRDLERVERVLLETLPEGELIFPADQVTDRSVRFLAGELVREKLMRLLGQEVPHRIAVEVERYVESEGRTEIDAVIWVERASQKPIVLGRQGARLKQIGTQARQDIQRLIGGPCHLGLWVKVKPDWSDNQRALTALGYVD